MRMKEKRGSYRPPADVPTRSESLKSCTVVANFVSFKYFNNFINIIPKCIEETLKFV